LVNRLVPERKKKQSIVEKIPLFVIFCSTGIGENYPHFLKATGCNLASMYLES
jgi:hypothetical protein